MSSSDSNIEVSMKPFQDLYVAKDWPKAMQWLDSQKFIIGEELYYFNMGVVSLKLEQLPLARFYFEQARLKGMNDPWLYRNIDSIKQDLGVHMVETPSFFEQSKNKILSYVAIEYITTGVLVLFLAILLYWLNSKLRKSFYIVASIVLFVLGLTFFVITNSQPNMQITQHNEAIVLEQVSIYEGPSGIFEELGKLPEGLKVKWNESDHGWAKISEPINFRGWVQLDEKFLKELK